MERKRKEERIHFLIKFYNAKREVASRIKKVKPDVVIGFYLFRRLLAITFFSLLLFSLLLF